MILNCFAQTIAPHGNIFISRGCPGRLVLCSRQQHVYFFCLVKFYVLHKTSWFCVQLKIIMFKGWSIILKRHLKGNVNFRNNLLRNKLFRDNLFKNNLFSNQYVETNIKQWNIRRYAGSLNKGLIWEKRLGDLLDYKPEEDNAAIGVCTLKMYNILCNLLTKIITIIA